jgi:hypothetical protein
VRDWARSDDLDRFVGSHSGYVRLPVAVRPVRGIELDHRHHRLRIHDAFEGAGIYDVEIPLHLAPGVHIERRLTNEIHLLAAGRRFRVRWSGDGWQVAVEAARVSPSYGVAVQTERIVWRGRTTPLVSLAVSIENDE